MQLTTFLSTAALAATAVATDALVRASAVELNQACKLNEAYARVINRCDYDVHLWSVYKGTGCPTGGMVTLKTGESYAENYANTTDPVGVSIKISKTEECKSNDIVQLEYYIESKKEDFNFNYLDVSYVDCIGGDCPTKQEGYYLVSGSQTGEYASSADNTWCPVMHCNDPVSCAKISYIDPNDTQTKTCDPKQNIDFYMCGGNAPTEDYESAPQSSVAAPSPSSTKQVEYSTEEAEYSTAAPTSTSTSSEEDAYTELINVAAAAVTNAPDAKAVDNANSGLTKTKVVYVTAYEYVNAKRHAHGHARRHQPFHA
jgi:hypothetical protein